MKETNTSITIYGKVEDNPQIWKDWYKYCKFLTERLGYTSNYIEISSETFKPRKVLTIKRVERRLMKAIDDEESLKHLCVYSLKEGFKQAVFDYNTYVVRYCGGTPNHITLSFPTKIYETIDIKSIIEELKNYIEFSHGEIYELPISESTFFYAMKVNSLDTYKGLKIIRKL